MMNENYKVTHSVTYIYKNERFLNSFMLHSDLFHNSSLIWLNIGLLALTYFYQIENIWVSIPGYQKTC